MLGRCTKIPIGARRWIKRLRLIKQNLTAGDGKIDKVLDYEIYDKSAALDVGVHPPIDRDPLVAGISSPRPSVSIRRSVHSTWLAH